MDVTTYTSVDSVGVSSVSAFSNFGNNANSSREAEETSTVDHLDIAHCVILGTIGVLAVCTNCLSLVIMFRCRWWHQKSIIILASLAVADLFSGLTSPVIMFSWYLLPPTEYTVHNYLDAVVDVPIYASVCHIVLVGVDRFIAINFPMKHDNWMSTRRVAIALVIIWSVCLLRFAVLPFGVLSSTPENPADDDTEAMITEEDHQSASGVTFYSVLEISLYCGLLLFIVHLYGRLWYIARQQERRIHALLVRDQSTCAANGTKIPTNPTLKTSKANKTCGCILITFVFCWMPFLIARLVEQARGVYDPYNMSVLLECLLDFCKASSCVNFFIYTWTSRRFRLAYKRILRCQTNMPNMMAENTEMTF